MVILNKGKIKLRPLAVEDAGALAKLANNKKIWDNLRDALPYPYLLNDAINYIAMCENEDPQLTFAIEYQGEFAGVIGLIQKHDVYRLSAEMGLWIGEPFWNKGIGTEAVKLIVDYAFKNLLLVRVFSCVFEFNSASQRILEKAGFIKEATFKNAVIKNNIICNECHYAIFPE